MKEFEIIETPKSRWEYTLKILSDPHGRKGQIVAGSDDGKNWEPIKGMELVLKEYLNKRR